MKYIMDSHYNKYFTSLNANANIFQYFSLLNFILICFGIWHLKTSIFSSPALTWQCSPRKLCNTIFFSRQSSTLHVNGLKLVFAGVFSLEGGERWCQLVIRPLVRFTAVLQWVCEKMPGGRHAELNVHPWTDFLRALDHCSPPPCKLFRGLTSA